MIFYKESKKKGGWARVNEIFYKESKSKINIFFFWGGGGGGGARWGLDGRTDPNQIAPSTSSKLGA